MPENKQDKMGNKNDQQRQGQRPQDQEPQGDQKQGSQQIPTSQPDRDDVTRK